MIARRMCGHAAPRSRVTERKNGVRRASCLERADLLKIFALKKKGRPARRIQPRARHYRRTMDMRTNPLMRRLNAIEIQGHNRFLSS